MDFGLSKENIQPLRGGRNVTQLEVALQAQSSLEVQRELLHQKEEFESAIRGYEGDDPLENWYQFISWVEQSYPKHGLEGNLMHLLEDCLSKFEHDSKYANDVRLCKLFIKYIDLQQNPLELYQMLHSQGLCRGIADLYRAWAYYHEAVGDFQSAHMVLKTGMRELAQPYAELVTAHENMVFAAGQQVIFGVDQSRLMNQRQVLTNLSCKSGAVGSVRTTASSSDASVLPTAAPAFRSNAAVAVYQDDAPVDFQGAAAPPVSILSISRREAPNENALKPGAWTAIPQRERSTAHSITRFAVHQDASENYLQGLRLPKTFAPITQEDFTTWKSVLAYLDPEDSTKIPMYPKALVYSNNTEEYSIEEIRSRRYVKTTNKRLSVPVAETQLAVESITQMSAGDASDQLSMITEQESDGINQAEGIVDRVLDHNESIIVNVSQQGNQLVNWQEELHGQPEHRNTLRTLHQQENLHMQMLPQQESHILMHEQDNVSISIAVEHKQNSSFRLQHVFQEPANAEHSYHHTSLNQNQSLEHHVEQGQMLERNTEGLRDVLQTSILQKSLQEPLTTSFHDLSQNKLVMSDCEAAYIDLWRTPTATPEPRRESFVIFEDPNVQVQRKGSAMKTPFKDISTDDLAETGSRGGLDVAAAAQPGDGAKRILCFEDDIDSCETQRSPNNDTTIFDTQTFNFNLNTMKVSTPRSSVQTVSREADNFRRELFVAKPEKDLSVIIEEKSYGSGSSVNATQNVPKMIAEQNNYHFNLAQNLKANEELRASLLGDLMECEEHLSMPVIETMLPTISPLSSVPTNPFKPALLSELLEKVGFPGCHSTGFKRMHSVPKPVLKKDTNLGNERYVVEKALGKGAYGFVYKAVNARTKELVALKYQKPSNKWEFYICHELHVRLAKNPLKTRFMDIQTGYYSDQASIIVSRYSPYGSLLDLFNNFKQKMGRSIKECMCIYFSLEMLRIVDVMHEAKIIHADIKPDNFLVFYDNEQVYLQLIDFGCSIDMSLMPEHATFTRQVTTENFICCEMRDGRPWSYHTDLFCVAATAHVLLFDKYLAMQKMDMHWSVTSRFSRYWNAAIWSDFFSTLLNQQNGPADNKRLQAVLGGYSSKSEDNLTEMRQIIHILRNR